MNLIVQIRISKKVFIMVGINDIMRGKMLMKFIQTIKKL